MPYYFSEDVQKKLPYIYYNNKAAKDPFDSTVLLPEVFIKKQTTSIKCGAFELKPSTESTNHPYEIPLDKGNEAIWNFDDTPIRTKLKEDFIEFLITLEVTGLKPGAMEFIRQSLAQYMPLTFMETLYYHYGLYMDKNDGGYVDLHQGMRLRLDFQEYQLPDPMSDSSSNKVNGYVGNGVTYYDLIGFTDSESYPVIGFNAFLRLVQSHTVVDANEGGAGGMVDLLNASYACRYYRLLYPTTMVSSDDQGFAGETKNVTLIGAKTLKDLETATDSYRKGERLPVGSVCTFFRGRTVVVPEILIYLRGTPMYLPLGTTVRQLMNSHTYIPQNQAYIPNLKYNRWLLKVDDAPNNNTETLFPNFERVNFSGGNYRTYWDGSDCFDIPILKGDAFTFPIPDMRS